MWSIVFFLVILLAAVMVWIRVAPSDPARWHVDPKAATRPNGNGWYVGPDDGAPVFAATPAEVLLALDTIAMAEPRTVRLAGSVDAGRITYVSRSALMGYPDYTTVEAVPSGAGAAPVILARQRFGSKDLGVNRKRVERWTAALRARLSVLS